MSEERVRLLLVDDEASLRVPLKRYLENSFGYHVDAVADQRDALDLVWQNQGRYDVALIDEVLGTEYALPDEMLPEDSDGIHLMQQIRARYPDVEVIIFTGWDRKSGQRAIQAGGFRYLKKPPDYDELAMMIRTAAQQVRLRTISREILSEHDPDRVLDSIVVSARSLALADEAAIMLLNRESGKLEMRTRTYQAEPQWKRHFTGQDLSRSILESGQVVLVPDTGQDERVNPKMIAAGIQAFLGVPIPGEGGNLGVLYVYSRRGGLFEAWGTVALLQTLAGQAGLALVNAQNFSKVEAHARYMEALVRAGQGLTQATRLDEQLALAWDFVREQLRTPTFIVALYDSRREILSFPLAYDEGEPVPVPEKHEGEEWGIIGHVVRHGQEFECATGSEKRQRLRDLGIESIKIGPPCESCIYLPLRLGGDVIGAISIQKYVPHAFSPILLDAFRALGSQLAVAIKNTRLLEETRRAANQISALDRVVLQIGEERQRGALLQRVIEQAIALLGAKGGAVYLLNPTREFFAPAASAGMPLASDRRFGITEGLSGRVLRTGHPEAIDDYYAWDGRLAFLDEQQLTAVAAAPIRVGDRIQGTMVVHSTVPGKGFEPHEMDLLQQLANHAGLALQKADMVVKLEAIQRVSTLIASSLDVHGVLQRTCQAATELFDADHSGLVVFEPGLASGTVQAEYPDQPHALGARIAVEGVPAEERLVSNREPLVLADVRQAEQELGPVTAVLTGLGIRSIAIVPIVCQDRVLGSLSLDSVGHAREFTPDEVELCQVFAANVAAAVENARLYAEAMEANRWREALIEHAFDGVVAIDQQQRITVFNHRAEEMFGWTAGDVMGKRTGILYGDLAEAREILRVVNVQGAISDLSITCKHRDGARFPALLSATLIRDSEDRPIGQAGFVRDQRAVTRLEGRLQALIEVNQAITGSLDLDEVLGLVMASAVAAFPTAHGASIHLYDERSDTLHMQATTYGYSPAALAASALRPGEGIAGWVFEQRQPAVVDDVGHDDRYKLIEHTETPPHKSIISVPLQVGEQCIGALSLDNLDATGAFGRGDIRLVSTFADQVAIAIDNARRMDELEQMRRAAEAMSRALVPPDALRQIVDSAVQILQADSAALWSYDEVQDKFIPDELVAAGIPADEVERFREQEPRPGRTAETVMDRGYVAVADLADPHYDFLGTPTRELLKRIGVRSFQGVVLKLGDDERLGVLYVNYNRLRGFDEDDAARLRTFVSHATLALKNARLLAQTQRTREAAGAIAGVTVQEDLRVTLGAIARNARQVLASDAVSLYAYDEATGLFGDWAAETLPSLKREALRPPGELQPESVVWNILRLARPPYYCWAEDDAAYDEVLGGTFNRFTGVRAAIGIQLRVGEHRMGVMFANYLSAHRFTSDEIATVQLFADQAGVAIRNAQLYQVTSRLYEQAQLVARVSREAARHLDLDAFLQTLFALVKQELQQRDIPVYLSLGTYDDESATLSYHETPFYPRSPRPGPVSLDAPGIMPWAARTRQLYYAPDVAADERYFCISPDTRSELAVPILSGDQLLGVLDLESPLPDAFAREDMQFLQTLANQVATTIRNVQQYEDLKRARGLVAGRTALAWTGMASSAWRHAIDKHAVTIREQAQLLRRDWQGMASQPGYAPVPERIATIERLATQILDKPITPPLSAEEGLELVALNDLVGERARQLWQNDPYRRATLKLQLDLPDRAAVRVSREWVRRAFDNVVDNAVHAVIGRPPSEITIGTRRGYRAAEIVVTDTGPGIPEDIHAKIGLGLIEKAEDAKGLGMGLLMAQTIVQAFGGEIRVGATGPTGTTMVISLPLDPEVD